MTKTIFKLLVIFVRSIQNGVVGFNKWHPLIFNWINPAFQLTSSKRSQKFWKNMLKGKGTFKNFSEDKITLTYFTSLRNSIGSYTSFLLLEKRFSKKYFLVGNFAWGTINNILIQFFDEWGILLGGMIKNVLI